LGCVLFFWFYKVFISFPLFLFIHRNTMAHVVITVDGPTTIHINQQPVVLHQCCEVLPNNTVCVDNTAAQPLGTALTPLVLLLPPHATVTQLLVYPPCGEHAPIESWLYRTQLPY
jgi:hypothetical protein